MPELKIKFGKLGDKPPDQEGADPKTDAGATLCELLKVAEGDREEFLAALDAYVMSVD